MSFSLVQPFVLRRRPGKGVCYTKQVRHAHAQVMENNFAIGTGRHPSIRPGLGYFMHPLKWRYKVTADGMLHASTDEEDNH